MGAGSAAWAPAQGLQLQGAPYFENNSIAQYAEIGPFEAPTLLALRWASESPGPLMCRLLRQRGAVSHRRRVNWAGPFAVLGELKNRKKKKGALTRNRTRDLLQLPRCASHYDKRATPEILHRHYKRTIESREK